LKRSTSTKITANWLAEFAGPACGHRGLEAARFGKHGQLVVLGQKERTTSGSASVMSCSGCRRR